MYLLASQSTNVGTVWVYKLLSSETKSTQTCLNIIYVKINNLINKFLILFKQALKTRGLMFPSGREATSKKSIIPNVSSREHRNTAVVVESCAKQQEKTTTLITDTYVAVISQTQWLPLQPQGVNWSHKRNHKRERGQDDVYCHVLKRPLNSPSDPQDIVWVGLVLCISYKKYLSGTCWFG